MPKVKTRSAAKKRFKKVGNGKIKCSKAFRRHLLTKKSSKTKRQLRKGGLIHDSNLKAVRGLLPY